MKIIGHRGFSAAYPENSLIAFQQALKAGANGIECDLRLSADGVLYLFHDDDLQRLCGQNGAIEQLTNSEIETLRVKGKEPICRLEELFSELPVCVVNLEIKKSPLANQVVEKLIQFFNSSPIRHEVFISSFSMAILEQLRQSDLKFPLSLVLEPPVTDEELEEVFSLSWIQTWNLSKELFFSSKLPDSARRIWLWTLNDKADWERSLSQGSLPEAIVTDEVEKAVSYFQRERR
ncbi:MAG: glycerophosphodiester phosphodiesterase [Bradymonadales bacterium]|nr:MAG: glycerophosphodiester phosphodiesterase [Bradymonadales bacterium]